MPGRAEVVGGIPVFCNGVKLFDYWLGNLFSKWGNGDGDDDRLLSIGGELVEHLEALGYKMKLGWGIHNSLCLRFMKRGRKKWENHWATEEVWQTRVYKKVWRSLPEDIRDLFGRLSREGIHWGSIFACLLHDYWNFYDFCPYGEDLPVDHSKYILEAVPTERIVHHPASRREFLEDLEPLSVIKFFQDGSLKPARGNGEQIDQLICEALAVLMKTT
jgi:hypothetical protein